MSRLFEIKVENGIDRKALVDILTRNNYLVSIECSDAMYECDRIYFIVVYDKED